MTGYDYNAITPFFMKQPLPVVLSEDIRDLQPAYFWFSGGRINVKMGVSVADFLSYFGSRAMVVRF